MEIDNNNSINMKDNIYFYIIHTNIPKMITFDNLLFNNYNENNINFMNSIKKDDNNILINIGYIMIDTNTLVDNINVDIKTVVNTIVENTLVENTHVDNTTVDNTTVDNTTFENTLFDNTTVDNTPLDNTNVDNTTVDNTLDENTTVENTLVDNTTIDNTLLDNTTIENTTVDNTPLDNTIVDNTTVDNTTVENTTVEDTIVKESNYEILYIMRNGYKIDYAGDFLNSIKKGSYDDTIDIISIYNVKKERLCRVYKNKDNFNNFIYKINYFYKGKFVENDVDVLKYDMYNVIYKVVSECYGKIVDNKINDVLCTLFVK